MTYSFLIHYNDTSKAKSPIDQLMVLLDKIRERAEQTA